MCSSWDLVARSAFAHLFYVFGVPAALHRDLCSGAIDRMDIFRRKLDGNCPNVLSQALQLPCARDRHDPRFLRKQPGQGNLCGCRILLFGDVAKQINQ